MASAARHASVVRGSLAPISINLPDAPAAFRHLPQSGSGHLQSGLGHFQSRLGHFQSGLGHHAPGDPPVPAGMPSSGLLYQGDAAPPTKACRQQSTKDSISNVVSVVLPDSPKRIAVRKALTARHGLAPVFDGTHTRDSGIALHGATSKPDSLSKTAQVLFGNAVWDAGPPRLQALPALHLSFTQGSRGGVHCVDGGDVSLGNDQADVSLPDASAAAAAASTLSFPLQQSDFLR